MPASRRSRSPCFRVGSRAWRATLDSRCWVMWSGCGTKNRISSRPTSAIPAVNQNSPCRPNRWVSTGPSTMATAKETPMLMPIIAIALVRCCSRVRSESSAITAAEIAPAPCRTRPAITPRWSRHWPRGCAGGEDQQPDDDHRAPADAVGNGPEGNLQDRLGQAIGADGQADQRRVVPARSWP